RSIPKKNRRLPPRLALTSSAKRSVRNVGATVSTHPGHVLSPQQDPHRTTYEASLSSFQKEATKILSGPTTCEVEERCLLARPRHRNCTVKTTY
ncbi:unnamed protein product, partial [Musa acuminata var. zebrina]